MAQAVGAAVGVAAGTGAAPTAPGAGGIAALFAALLGEAAPADGAAAGGTPADLLAALLAGLQQAQGGAAGNQGVGGQGGAGGLSALLAQLTATANDLKDGGTLPQDGMQQLIQQLSQLAGMLQQAGVDLSKITDAKGLQAALEKLGVKPAEAAKTAAAVLKLLDAVKAQARLDDETAPTPGALLALLAGQMPQPKDMEPKTGDAPAVDATVTAQPVRGHVHAKARQAFQHQKATAADLARAVAGISEDAADPEVATPAGPAKNMPTAPGDVAKSDDDLAAVAAAVVDAVLPESAPADAASDSSLKVDASAVVATPQAAAQAVTAVTRARADAKVDGVGSAPKVIAVSPDKVLPKPEGVEVMRFSTDAEGKDVVERKIDATTLRAADPQPQLGAEAAGVQAGRTERTAHGVPATFAERLAQATRADTTTQTVVQVKGLADQGGGTIRMILNPPELGEVRIEITVTNGRVEGQISATNNAVVELLARDVHSLKHGLESSGLKLGDQGLSLMLNTGSQQQNPQGQPGQGGRQAQGSAPSWTGAEADLDAALPVDPGAWVAPERILDVRV